MRTRGLRLFARLHWPHPKGGVAVGLVFVAASSVLSCATAMATATGDSLAARSRPLVGRSAEIRTVQPAVPTRHVVDSVDGFVFDLPTTLRTVPVGVLHGSAGPDVHFLAVRARRTGVVVEDVIVSVYPRHLGVSPAVLQTLLGASDLTPVHVSTARVSFGRVLKGTVTLTRSGGLVHAIAYLFHRGRHTYAVAFNGLSWAAIVRLASVVMGSWGP